MISREEFNHQIQAGEVRSALASVLQSLQELEITTQLASDGSGRFNSIERPYVRTKIDLLGGRVIDEVSANFADGDNGDLYFQLHRSHCERVAASYDLACDYLARIESLLAAMPAPSTGSDLPLSAPPAAPTSSDATAPTLRPFDQRRASPAQCGAPPERPISPPPNVPTGRGSIGSPPKSPPPALVAKLQQARASLTSRLGSDIAPAMLFPSRTAAAVSSVGAELEPADSGDESDEMAIVLKNPPVADCGLSAADVAAVTTIVDEEIDLAIEENGELWAGWVEEDSEDEDEYSPAALSPQPPTNPTLLDWQEIPTPKYVDPIEVKPIIPRPAARSLDPIDQWDKFEPDYLGIDFDPRPAIDRRLPIDN